MFKILMFCLSFNILSNVNADQLRIAKTIKDSSAQAFVGTYKAQSKSGQVVILTVERKGDFLIATQQEGTTLETVFKFPLLTSDFESPEETKYEDRGRKVTVTNWTYKVVSDQHLRMYTDAVTGKSRTVSETEMLIKGKELLLSVEALDYSRKSILLSWQPKNVEGSRKKYVFTKITSSVMDRKLLEQLQAKEIARASKETDVELQSRLQEQTDQGHALLNIEALSIGQEVPVRTSAKIFEWVAPQTSSINNFNEGHSAKIIPYEKFLKYQADKACDEILNGRYER